MKSEVKRLLFVAREFVSKKSYLRFKKIEDENDLVNVLNYTLLNLLNERYEKLEKIINEKENRSEDVFFAKNKLIIIPSKVKHFEASYDLSEFMNAMRLLQETQREVENV